MKYFLAFYLAAWIMSLLKLYYPSVRTLKQVDKESILVRREMLGWIVAGVGFLLVTPFTFPVSLSEKLSKEFIVAFCDKALEK